jgi:hypothetical protein
MRKLQRKLNLTREPWSVPGFLCCVLENSYEIEFVQVMVDSDHPYWGDLKIELISPAGTVKWSNRFVQPS